VANGATAVKKPIDRNFAPYCEQICLMTENPFVVIMPQSGRTSDGKTHYALGLFRNHCCAWRHFLA